MKAFYGLMLEEKKEERTYQFNAPIGVQFDEVIEILNIFRSMVEDMSSKAKEQEEKSLKEAADETIQEIKDEEIDIKGEENGITS